MHLRTARVQAAQQDHRTGVAPGARRLLGISEQASVAEVRRAFRKIATALHPDRHDGAPSAEQQRRVERFARISAAYHLLVA